MGRVVGEGLEVKGGGGGSDSSIVLFCSGDNASRRQSLSGTNSRRHWRRVPLPRGRDCVADSLPVTHNGTDSVPVSDSLCY